MYHRIEWCAWSIIDAPKIINELVAKLISWGFQHFKWEKNKKTLLLVMDMIRDEGIDADDLISPRTKK